jgi:hypothetical protein
MPEEEEPGHTFVDKRRINAAPQPDPEPERVPAEPEFDDEAYDESGDELEMPDVYGLISYSVSLFAQQAWLKMGLLADPRTGEAAPDLPEAKIAIDVIGDLVVRLEAAPEESVPAQVKRDLRNLLNEMRLNYVARVGDAPA